MKIVKWLVLVLVLLVAVLAAGGFTWFKNYFAWGQQVLSQTSVSPVAHSVEVVATGLKVPWSVVFPNPDQIMVSERTGQIRLIDDGQLLAEPIYEFAEVIANGEGGLMSIALSPEFDQDRQLFACLVYAEGSTPKLKVVRLSYADGRLSDQQTVIDQIPAAQAHDGCRVRFGPDGKLYVTTGDALDKDLAQEVSQLNGKILRLNPDGSIPQDNPFPNSPVFSLGHRNPQGLDWHPVTGQLYATEHGPSIFDGPAGGDEVNLIEAGGNYGWPLVSHHRNQPGLIAPLTTFTPAEAPGSGSFYAGTVFPQWQNDYFIGALKGEGIIRIRFDQQNPTQILELEKVAGIEAGRVRDVVTGPDGLIYFTSSNQDGRGTIQPGDDKVYRLVPEN
jgi:glucose/arabinose dehydrogenase